MKIKTKSGYAEITLKKLDALLDQGKVKLTSKCIYIDPDGEALTVADAIKMLNNPESKKNIKSTDELSHKDQGVDTAHKLNENVIRKNSRAPNNDIWETSTKSQKIATKFSSYILVFGLFLFAIAPFLSWTIIKMSPGRLDVSGMDSDGIILFIPTMLMVCSCVVVVLKKSLMDKVHILISSLGIITSFWVFGNFYLTSSLYGSLNSKSSALASLSIQEMSRGAGGYIAFLGAMSIMLGVIIHIACKFKFRTIEIGEYIVYGFSILLGIFLCFGLTRVEPYRERALSQMMSSFSQQDIGVPFSSSPNITESLERIHQRFNSRYAKMPQTTEEFKQLPQRWIRPPLGVVLPQGEDFLKLIPWRQIDVRRYGFMPWIYTSVPVDNDGAFHVLLLDGSRRRWSREQLDQVLRAVNEYRNETDPAVRNERSRDIQQLTSN